MLALEGDVRERLDEFLATGVAQIRGASARRSTESSRDFGAAGSASIESCAA